MLWFSNGSKQALSSLTWGREAKEPRTISERSENQDSSNPAIRQQTFVIFCCTVFARGAKIEARCYLVASRHRVLEMRGALGTSVVCRADKGWAVKRTRPSKKVWCSGLGLCLEMSLVFDFGQGLRRGLFIRHCRCYWIMAAWFVFLHFFLVPFCWHAVSERQISLFFAGGLVGVDKHLFQRVSLITSMTLSLNYIFVLLLANVDVISKQKQLSTI